MRSRALTLGIALSLFTPLFSALSSATSAHALTPRPPIITKAVPGDQQASITWKRTPDFASSSKYVIEISSDGAKTWDQVNETTSDNETSALILNLENGKTYPVRVRAIATDGTRGDASPVVSVTPSALAPTPEITSVYPSDKSIALNWKLPDAPKGTSAVTIISYIIQYSTDGGAHWKKGKKKVPGSATTWTLHNLTNGKPYAVRIAGVSAAGQGEFSIPENAVPNQIDPPTIVQLEDLKNATIISWKPSKSQTIDSYLIERSIDFGEKFVVIDSVDSSKTSTKMALQNPDYVFRVTAVDVLGERASSEPQRGIDVLAKDVVRTTQNAPSSGSFAIWIIGGFIAIALLWRLAFIRRRRKEIDDFSDFDVE